MIKSPVRRAFFYQKNNMLDYILQIAGGAATRQIIIVPLPGKLAG